MKKNTCRPNKAHVRARFDDEKVIAVWVFIDGGTWYPWTLDKTGFKRYTVIAFRYRSAVERFFGDIECRIRWFWNSFIGNYNRKSLQLWLEALAGFRNYMKDPKEAVKLR